MVTTSQVDRDKRILIFILTYFAEKHIGSVLERIPSELFNREEVHILCIDDASDDRTTDTARRWVQQRNITNVTIYRNPVNQGYGGNQKLGYRFAIDRGFDFVILLHGDGQYAPELLPRFIEVLKKTEADVVLGSRMTSVKNAYSGGMPIYKIIGNRVLTAIQNLLTGRKLSEYHTGYRAYSTAFLRRAPFEINTNDFHFDTEILLQAMQVKARIMEFPIPTHYGEEVCRVKGMKYARDVLMATLQYKLHQFGMVCSLKYRDLAPIHYEDKTEALYTSHRMALEFIEKTKPRTLLDIGCGPGFIARQCERMGIEVTGLDAREPLPGMMTAFQKLDLEYGKLEIDPFAYDVVLLLDVVEHLRDPEGFLLDIRNKSASLGSDKTPSQLVLSTPNVAFAAIRFNLLAGRFNYAERGILDISHTRLFTRSSLTRALTECGYVMDRIEPVPVPFETVIGGRIGRWLAPAARFLCKVWPNMFAFQFLVVCHPLPGVRQLLIDSERHLVAPDGVGPSESTPQNHR